MFPPLVMEIKTGSTNNHITQIYFVLAALMYWWDWLVAPVYSIWSVKRGSVMLAVPVLIDRSMTLNGLDWSERKRKYCIINPRWRPN
jgi:hypothetical protein